MMVEATIRPIFQKPDIENLPQFYYYNDAGVSTLVSHTIRPPVGQLWQLDYANVVFDTNNGVAYVYIQLTNGTTTSNIEMLRTSDWTNSVSWGAFGNGPLLLSNDNYLIIGVKVDTGTANFNTVVSMEVI